MRQIKPGNFTGDRPWAALDIEAFDAATVRLHWTDEAYVWHVNDGPEVFVLLSGSVRMHSRGADGAETHIDMVPGDVVHCRQGDEHRAEPLEPSRILVVERPGSI
ncbi:MAG: cupin [Alphaproteobacteria bacterium]|nr:cupin [Alphaproteobacteria bacterium]